MFKENKPLQCMPPPKVVPIAHALSNVGQKVHTTLLPSPCAAITSFAHWWTTSVSAAPLENLNSLLRAMLAA